MFGVGAGEAVEQRPAAAQGGAQTQVKGRDPVLPAHLGPILHEDRRHREEAVQLHENLRGGSHRQLRKQGDLHRLQRHTQKHPLLLQVRLRTVQQQLRQAAGPVPLPARRRISHNRGGHRQDLRLQVIHYLLPLFQLRKDHQAGRHQEDLLHGLIREIRQRKALHRDLLQTVRRGQDLRR